MAKKSLPLSWHTMLGFAPPLVGCVISDGNYSFGLLQENGECAINIPTAALAEKVVGCGNTTGARGISWLVAKRSG